MAGTNPLLNLVVIRSADVERAVAFYQAIGLTFAKESHGKGPEHYAASLGGVVFEIYPLAAGAVPTTSVRIGFAIASVDEILEQLTKFGAKIVSPPADSPWGRRAVLLDPDGH